MKKLIIIFLFLIIPLQIATAENQNKLKEVNKMIDERKFASAANLIARDEGLMNDPKSIMKLTDLLIDNYLTAINYKLFGLKDLEKGELVKDLRGKAGTYEIIEGDLEKLLYEKIKKHSDDPYLNFAVGKYISRGYNCKCLKPEFFPDDPNGDFQYFEKANKKGIYNYWSLFRIGFHYHQKGDVDNAILHYEKSFNENSSHTPTIHNLSILYLNQNKLEKALFYSNKAIGKYEDPAYDTDTYHLNGIVNWELKNYSQAEKSFKKALSLLNYHKGAFSSLLSFYRDRNNKEGYVQTVSRYISNDLGNIYYFNNYINFLSGSGLHSFDEEVYQLILKIQPKDSNKIGALYFNMGKFSLIKKDRESAIVHFKKSLSEFEKMESPPKGAINALKSMIARIEVKKN